MNRSSTFSWLFISLSILCSCSDINVFERNTAIPEHSWASNFKPIIEFDISDTTALYNLFIVVRHNNLYKYNNLWLKGTVLEPGSKEKRAAQYDLLLADNAKGWLGTGMDDIFEHRILIQPRTRFKQKGKYQFMVEQIMREDPLPNMMNVGLRIEKVQ